MSKMLNLVDHLLLKGRNLETLGLLPQACRIYRRLAKIPQLPKEAAEETQSRLGAVRLEQGHFGKARRHLMAALVHQPDNPRYHYLLASAIQEDPQGDPKRAAYHFRRCLRLDPDSPEYLVPAAHHFLNHGERQEGLELLKRAMDVASDDPAIVCLVAHELRELGEHEEASTWLRIALFRNGCNSRFHQLWSEHQFHLLRACQQQAKRLDHAEDGPVLLPFVATEQPNPTRTPTGKILRHDQPSGVKGPNVRTSRRSPR